MVNQLKSNSDELIKIVDETLLAIDGIKNAITNNGVEVTESTPVIAYIDKIDDVFEAGKNSIPTYDGSIQQGAVEGAQDEDYALIMLTSPEGATLNTAGTKCDKDIEIIPALQEKTATESGIITADNGYVAMKSVDTSPVYEAGKKSEYDAFWDAYQDYGRREKYEYAFTGVGESTLYGWTEENFKPKYDIILGNGYTSTNMFWNNSIEDVPAVLEKLGIKFDTTKCTYFQQTFQMSRSRRWGVINASKATSMLYTFLRAYCRTIEKLIVNEKCIFDKTFHNCASLVNLTIEGTIGQGGLDLSWSPLSKASLTSVVNALSATTTGLTVTLRTSSVNKAFETSEGANDGLTSQEWLDLIATKQNWTINTLDS